MPAVKEHSSFSNFADIRIQAADFGACRGVAAARGRSCGMVEGRRWRARESAVS